MLTSIPQALDMKRRKWVTLPSLKVARTGAGCCVVGNVVYVVGGAVIPSDASSNSIPTASIEILDLSTAYDVFPDTPSVNGQRRPTKWYTGPPMVSARAYLAVTANDGVVYAMGGVDANGVTVDAVEILDTVTGKEKGQNLPVRTLLSGGGSTTKEVFTRGKETNDEGNKVTCGYTVYTKANWFCGKEFKTQTGKQLRCVASTGSVWSSQGCPSCKRFEANLKPSLLKGLKDFTFKLPSKEEMEINAAKFPPPPRNLDTENEKEKEVPVEVEAENPNPGWLGWEFGSPSTLRNSDGSGAQVIEEEVRVDVTEVSADYPSFCTTNGYDVPCTVYAKLYDTPRVGTCEAYREFAEEKWMRIVEREHPGAGNGYGNSYRGNNQYGFVTMENFWNAHVFPAFKDRDISYKDVLVVHGNKADGFCFDAEAGAMIAFGEPSAGNGYGYCRGGGNALKRLHIYILLK